MASLDNRIQIMAHYRPCMANDKKALFHGWVETSRVHRAVSRSDVTGIITEVYGICEFEDGTIRKVGVNSIRFTDKLAREYA